MMQKFKNLEIMCFDHCDVTDDIFMTIFSGMHNTDLRFLNLSWNQLSGACMPLIVDCLVQNQSMTKLTLHHNHLGDADMTKFAAAIMNH